MNKRFDSLLKLISRDNTVLRRQSHKTNGSNNETYFDNVKEIITKETKNCKKLHYQIYYTQELQNCYKNLI